MARRNRKKPKKQKIFNKTTIAGIVIVGLMVLSGIGYMWSDQEGGTRSNYNGYKFTAYNNKWYASIGESDVGFSFHPEDLENIDAGQGISTIQDSRVIYLTFDPDSELVSYFENARLELENELPAYFNIYPDVGVSSPDPDYSAFPIVTCENATVFIPVLYFKEGNETKIIQEGPCVILQAMDWYDVEALKDRLMYGLFGIM